MNLLYSLDREQREAEEQKQRTELSQLIEKQKTTIENMKTEQATLVAKQKDELDQIKKVIFVYRIDCTMYIFWCNYI